MHTYGLGIPHNNIENALGHASPVCQLSKRKGSERRCLCWLQDDLHNAMWSGRDSFITAATSKQCQVQTTSSCACEYNAETLHHERCSAALPIKGVMYAEERVYRLTRHPTAIHSQVHNRWKATALQHQELDLCQHH